MVPVIRVDEEVFAELQTRAEPFVDSPNSVLRTLLGLELKEPKGGKMPKTRMPEGARTQEREFYRPILEPLADRGGRARVAEILESIEGKMGSQFTDTDLAPISSGETRWRNTAKWARKYMIFREDPPLLNPSSPHGWWEITDEGRRFLRAD